MKLIEEKKFLADFTRELKGLRRTEGKDYFVTILPQVLSKHLKDIKDEPQHPSGMDHTKIKVRNELRAELRQE